MDIRNTQSFFAITKEFVKRNNPIPMLTQKVESQVKSVAEHSPNKNLNIFQMKLLEHQYDVTKEAFDLVANGKKPAPGQKFDRMY